MTKTISRMILMIAVTAVLVLAVACIQPPEGEPEPVPEPEPETVDTPPVIHYVTAEKEVVPGTEVKITCVATDEDGDTLSFAWTADEGNISGQSDMAVWTAPDAEGSYTVDVTVSDGNGGEASESITIAVNPRPNNAPQVKLKITYNDEVKAGTLEEPVRIKRYETAQIEAIATDPDGDELSYRWSSSKPRLEGVGSEVTFFAAETKDQVVIVTVTDSRGAETKATAYIYVPCCGSQ